MRSETSKKIINTLIDKGYMTPLDDYNKVLAELSIRDILFEFQEENENSFKSTYRNRLRHTLK